MITSNKKPTLVDLFSGCGGLSYGFEEAGFQILLGVDNWKDALDSFKLNHKGVQILLTDLQDFNPKIIENRYRLYPEDIDVVVGGPPCQGFSISGKRMIDDPRNNLYKCFVKFVRYFRPKSFVLENVPNLISLGMGTIKDQIIEDFETAGYKVSYRILMASKYGVPQNRKRVIFVGLYKDGIFEFPEETHGEGLWVKPLITSKDAIDDLPEDSIPDGSQYPLAPNSDYQKAMRKGSTGIFNHEIIIHTEKTKRIISMVPDGGNYKNLPPDLWTTRKVNIAWTRLDSKKPSFTIDTGHNHHFHYKYNRVPTARESARLQSFPDKFIFKGNKASALKQIGNAVPPLLSRAIAIQIKKYLDQYEK